MSSAGSPSSSAPITTKSTIVKARKPTRPAPTPPIHSPSVCGTHSRTRIHANADAAASTHSVVAVTTPLCASWPTISVRRTPPMKTPATNA